MNKLFKLAFITLFIFTFNNCSTQKLHKKRVVNSKIIGAEIINEHQFKRYMNINKINLSPSEPLIVMEATVD